MEQNIYGNKILHKLYFRRNNIFVSNKRQMFEFQKTSIAYMLTKYN